MGVFRCEVRTLFAKLDWLSQIDWVRLTGSDWLKFGEKLSKLVQTPKTQRPKRPYNIRISGIRKNPLVSLLKFSFFNSGPSLPDDYDGTGHQLVSNGDSLFYINTNENIFLQLQCHHLLQNCYWITMEQKLEIPRKYAVVSLVPDELVECNWK